MRKAKKQHQSKLKIILLTVFAILSPVSYAGEEASLLTGTLIIEGMRCEGNENTQCDFITKKYYQKPGEILDPDQVADARLRLDSLPQFRNVSIYLDKGSRKGYVIVVFSVKETSNIQYGLQTRFGFEDTSSQGCYALPDGDYCFSSELERQRLSLQGSVTNFNFLESGKRLSLGFDVGISKFDEVYTSDNSHLIVNGGDRLGEFDDRITSLLLHYDDPHLFGSPYYYMSATIQYLKYNSKSIIQNSENGTVRGDYENIAQAIDFNLGYRFGRFSYISAGVAYTKTKSPLGNEYNDPTFLEYGWDSRDDRLLPSTGSVMSVSYRTEFEYISASYSKILEIKSNRILDIGISGSANIEGSYDSRSYSTSANYTFLNNKDLYQGVYSGFRVGVGTTWHEDNDGDSGRHGLSMEYIRRTDDLIMVFGLTYSKSN